jgi:hypothetical protein
MEIPAERFGAPYMREKILGGYFAFLPGQAVVDVLQGAHSQFLTHLVGKHVQELRNRYSIHLAALLQTGLHGCLVSIFYGAFAKAHLPAGCQGEIIELLDQETRLALPSDLT